jgi:hypothetical protein
MKIILNTTSTNPDHNADCDCAVIEITPALVEQARNRAALARQALQPDNDLYELYFWGSPAELYDYNLVSACEEAVASASQGNDEDKAKAAQAWSVDLERNGHALLPDTVNLGVIEPRRTECGQTILQLESMRPEPEFAVAWIAIPKHSDIYVTTTSVPLRQLEAYVGGEAPGKTEDAL